MKNKIICLILLVILCIQPLALSAFAQTGNSAQYEYDKELFEASFNLNKTIYPDYPQHTPDAHVTRGEFSMMLTGIMGATDLKNTYTCFTDVPYDNPSAESVAFLTDLGVISRGELFYPDSPILYPQAVKMAVALAGYSVKAQAQGGYPAGYIAIGNSIGLAKGLSLTDEKLTYADVTILLSNLLEADIFRQVVFGDKIEYEEGNGHTFLSYYHKIHTSEGIVNATAYSGLTDANAALGENRIQIGNSVYVTEGNSYADYLGHNVKVYYKENGNKNEVVYIAKTNENILTLNSCDVEKFSDFTLSTYSEDKEEKYNISRSYVYIKNSKHKSITDKDQTPYFTLDSAIITLIDNNMDKNYDVVSVKEYKYSYIGSIDTERETISDQNTKDNFLNLGLSDCEYKIYDVTDKGFEEITLSDLSKDSFIAYTISEDKLLCNIYVINKYIDGTLSELTDSREIYVDDVEYKTSNYYNTYSTYITIGSKARFYIGIDGKIAYAIPLSSSPYKYGWVVDAGTNGGLDSNVKIKIFSQDGKMITPAVSDRVRLNGSAVSQNELKTQIDLWDDDTRFVKYTLNSDGILTKIITATIASDNIMPGEANKTDSDFVRYYSRENNFNYWSSPSLFVHENLATTNMLDSNPKTEKSSFRITSSTYSFIIPTAQMRGEDKNFKVTTSAFSNASTYAISAYDVDETSHAAATLCVGSIQASPTNRGNLIVERITNAINYDGENSIAISGYSFDKSRYITCYIPHEKQSEISGINPGDMVRLSYDENNEITGSVYKDFDLANYEFRITNIPNSTDYISGLIYSYNGGYMNLVTNCNIEKGKPVFPQEIKRNNVGLLYISEASIMFVDVKRTPDGSGVESVSVRPSDVNEMKTYLESGNNAHYCVSRRYQFGRASTVVIYNIIK
ncbi:MAG: hypothetical protein IKJ68_12755 [Clostridia bacterium]|nr:hypothetical protein [Clostridia bacterium]